jgi:sulfite reductase alpha subunit-like flavoprotein
MLNWEKEKDQIKKEALEEHTRLSRLFKEDRLSFERERKKMIDDVIHSANSEEQRERLRNMQKSWDNKMKKAGSKHNRFVMAQHLFWKHVDEVWNPSIQEFSRFLKEKTGR